MTTEPVYNYREMLRTAMNTMRRPNPNRLPVEKAVIDNICDEVIADTRYDSDTDARAWHRAALATKAILRDSSDDVMAEWRESHAGLPTIWTLPDLN
jgi:hypothetical protein